MIFFTADLHFGHGNIIQYCKRPFENEQQMNKGLIKNWNSVVSPEDEVFILGDFSIKGKNHEGEFRHILEKLNGIKHLILGNHDVPDPIFLTSCGFWSVHYPYFVVEEFMCVHDPALTQVYRDRKFLCGHVHDLFKQCKNAFNVGVDVRDYKPISIEEVRRDYEN